MYTSNDGTHAMGPLGIYSQSKHQRQLLKTAKASVSQLTMQLAG
jgi:hypothetical protein